MALDFGNKVENGGIPPNGVLPASEFNQLVAQVNKNEEDIAAIDEPNSIESIEATESQASGGNNVITITETNGTETTFNVKNGTDGANGVSLGDVEIADNLTTNDNTKVLSAKQGYVLKGLIDSQTFPIVDNLTEGGHTSALSAEMGKKLGEDIDALKGIETYVRDAELDTDGKYYYTNGNYWSKNGVSTSRNILVKAGKTINVTLITYQASTFAIAVLRANGNCNPSISVPYTSGVHDYSFTAQEDTNVRICYKTSDGFVATIDTGLPTERLKGEIDDVVERFGGLSIPFDQPKTYTYVNDELVENAGSLTTGCSTAKINIADYKVLLFSGYRNAYNGYFCAIFYDDEDNFVSLGLTSFSTKRATPEVQTVNYDMVNVLQEVPAGATKVVLQTTKDGGGADKPHLVIGFTDVPYNFIHEHDWRQDYYGIKGDGTTDDTVGLQNLLNNSRGEVTLRAGTYLITSSLYVNATKLRKINGNGAAIKVSGDITALNVQGACTDDASPAIQGQWNVDHAGFVLENLNITSVNDTEGLGIELSSCLKPIIKSCYIFHIKNGISMHRNSDVIIEGNNIYQCSNTGILFAQGSSVHQCNISANHISWCKDCIVMDDAAQINNIQITGNDLEVGSSYPTDSDNSCIKMIDSTSVIFGQVEIVGNTIQGHQGSSKIISITGSANTDSKLIHGVSIIGNFMSGCAGNLIELSFVKNIVISSNTVTTISNSFVNISNNAAKIAIIGNTLDNVYKLLTTEDSAIVSYANISSNAGNNASVTINGTSQDYISVVGNNLGGGTVTIGSATHKQEVNNI